MPLHCPRCGGRVPARQLDLRSGLTSCRRCRFTFDFGRRMPRCGRVRVAGPPDPAELPPRPPDIRLEEGDGVWRARWRWYNSSYNFMVLWSLFWNGIILFAALNMIASGHFRQLWNLSLHGPIGLIVGYCTLAGILNSTAIELTSHGLQVRHGPIPWFGGRRLLCPQVEQLFCRQSSVKTNHAYRYELCVVLTEGGTVRLAGGFKDPDEARFLERHIEARLGIWPQRVPGEYGESARST